MIAPFQRRCPDRQSSITCISLLPSTLGSTLPYFLPYALPCTLQIPFAYHHHHHHNLHLHLHQTNQNRPRPRLPSSPFNVIPFYPSCQSLIRWAASCQVAKAKSSLPPVHSSSPACHSSPLPPLVLRPAGPNPSPPSPKQPQPIPFPSPCITITTLICPPDKPVKARHTLTPPCSRHIVSLAHLPLSARLRNAAHSQVSRLITTAEVSGNCSHCLCTPSSRKLSPRYLTASLPSSTAVRPYHQISSRSLPHLHLQSHSRSNQHLQTTSINALPTLFSSLQHAQGDPAVSHQHVNDGNPPQVIQDGFLGPGFSTQVLQSNDPLRPHARHF